MKESVGAKKDKALLPAMPASEILKLDEEHITALAKDANLKKEDFVRLMQKTARASAERSAAAASKDINRAGTIRFLHPVSAKQTEDEEKLLAKAEKWLDRLYYSDKPAQSPRNERSPLYVKTVEVLRKAYAIERHRRVYELYESGVSLVEAVHQVSEEFRVRAKKSSNTPAIQKALEANMHVYHSETQIGEGSISNPGGMMDHASMYSGPVGPGLKFSADIPLNLRKNPRPRRYNDELEHD